MHDIAIREALVLVDGYWTPTDIGIEDGRFVAFGANVSSAKTTIDAKGLHCLPGGVDLHVHFNEPGRTHWEGFATGSIAGLAGGNTFVAEMPLNSIPSTTSLDALKTKLDAIGSQSSLDFGLWGGLVPGNAHELEALAEAGVVGFKAFMSPSGTDDFVNSDTETLRAGMKAIARTGKILALHAEDPKTLDAAAAQLGSKRSAVDWEAGRPQIAEINAIRIAIDLAIETGCRIHIVHVSSPEALDLISTAKAEGLEITCETCPHYLLLTIEDAERIGPAAKCAPPLRHEFDHNALWTALRHGQVDTIGSDHSPCPPDLKSGRSFYEAWGGISGQQHGLPLLWDRSFDDTNLFENIITRSTSEPSRLIGLKNKGALELGYDADFVLARRNVVETEIRSDQLHYRHHHSAYCGLRLRTEVVQTWLRGRCVYKDGKPIGEPRGRFIRFPA